MRGTWGNNLHLTIFGESHGAAIGMVVDGLPIGMTVDEAAIARDMARRAPGRDPTATARREADGVRIVSGVYKGRTTGAPVCGVIENTNTRSGDYDRLQALMRPGHADYAGYVKYRGMNDPRGGGHFSGRLTAPLVFAGALARQALAARGVECAAHIAAIADVEDAAFDPVHVSAEALRALRNQRFALLRAEKEADMRARVEEARLAQDSVGGVIECAAVGVPAGWGAPFFSSVESVAASLLYSIPAVKAVEFGAGMALSRMRGSQANDPLMMRGGCITMRSNQNGGVTGGITDGMPVICRVGIKPTPSIGQKQQSVNVQTRREETLEITGRHDPCIVPRAVPVVESALLLALLDLALEEDTRR
jgi:chorismate synthase